MKTLKHIAIGAFFSLGLVCSNAQDKKTPFNEPNYNQPRLFSDLPQKTNFRVSDMESLFEQPVGSSVTAKFSKDFHLQGTVVSKSSDATVKSVVVNATNRQGAVFTFTRITKEDGNIVYKGRVLSRNNGDALEIVFEDGQYFLKKKNYHEIVAE